MRREQGTAAEQRVTAMIQMAVKMLSQIELLEPAPGDVPRSWLPLSHDMGR
jgi:hypothetical protein